MTVDTEPQEVEEEMTQVLENSEESIEQEEPQEETKVPLSALQKERKKRQEAEAKSLRYEVESQFYKEQQSKVEVPEIDDETLYENVTKAELISEKAKNKEEILQEIRAMQRAEIESSWAASNPEKYEYITQNLTNFLEKKPNLTGAIRDATNRYEEAYILMEALSPRQRKEMMQPKKNTSPGSPNMVSKAAALNEATDLMSMTDEEYRSWRNSKKRR